MVQCLACHEPIAKSSAVIRGGLMGAAYTEAYFHCPSCGNYTIAGYRDAGGGRDEVTYRGPIPAEQAEPKLAIIAQCPDQLNRNCLCDAHRKFFAAWLDDIWEGAG